MDKPALQALFALVPAASLAATLPVGPGRAYADIQAAVSAAAAGDMVTVAPGTYAPFSSGNKALEIVAEAGPSKTIIDGGSAAPCAVLGSSDGQTNTVLRGFTLRNGYSSASGGGAQGGTLSGCVLSGNSAKSNGGGAYRSLLLDCTLRGNTAGSYGGGACDSALSRCIVAENTATSGDSRGGGLYGGTALLCLFETNSAVYGGGIYAGRENRVTATRCVLRGNVSTKTGGGAHAGRYDYILLDNCLVQGNAGSGGGGTIECTLRSCTVIENTAKEISGISGGVAYNTVCWDNQPDGVSQIGGAKAYSCLLGSSMSGGGMTACVFDDPLFDAASGVPGLFGAASPAASAGSADYVVSALDLGGNPRVVDGALHIGCHQAFAPAATEGSSYAFTTGGGGIWAPTASGALQSVPLGADGRTTLAFTATGPGVLEIPLSVPDGAADFTLLVDDVAVQAAAGTTGSATLRAALGSGEHEIAILHGGSPATFTGTGTASLAAAGGASWTESARIVAFGPATSSPGPWNLRAAVPLRPEYPGTFAQWAAASAGNIYLERAADLSAFGPDPSPSALEPHPEAIADADGLLLLSVPDSSFPVSFFRLVILP